MVANNLKLVAGTDVHGQGETSSGVSVNRLRRQYTDYLDSKRDEIDEQRLAEHYYHGDQWTKDELATLAQREQPPVTSNLIARKINGIVGLLERLRQDPKAYPRTPQHQQGADLATAVVRYVLDNNEWGAISPTAARNGGVKGIGGVELGIKPNENGDGELTIDDVDGDTYFYDPVSFKSDFKDVRYEGIAKWVTEDVAAEIFPDKADRIKELINTDFSFADKDQDRERKWIDSDRRRLRLVEHWYKFGGKWFWAFHVGLEILDEGESPFINEDGESISKFVMYSSFVDHDGDRYGFFRNMQSPQDEVNHHKSKAIHLLASEQVIAEAGAVDNVAKAKQEMAKSNGWVIKNRNRELEVRDKSLDFNGQMLFLEKAEREISTLAPDPAALTGDGQTQVQSGRAIQLLQQAGLAELGPFILSYRAWKIRLYRIIWAMVQRLWTAERYVRVTDDEDVADFIQINGFDFDDFGRPMLVNALGHLDVDIILDEGPDTINMMQDAFDALVQSGIEIPIDVFLELAPIQASVKKRLMDKIEQSQQQDPAQQAVIQGQLEKLAAEIEKLKTEAAENISQVELNRAKAMEELSRTEREEFTTVRETPALVQ